MAARILASDLFRSVPLGKGFLTGRIDDKTTLRKTDFRNIVPRFTSAEKQANQGLVDHRLDRRAEESNVCPDRTRLAPGTEALIVPIPGTTKLSVWRKTSEQKPVLKLTPDDLREIDSATAKIPVLGARYPEELERMTYL